MINVKIDNKSEETLLTKNIAESVSGFSVNRLKKSDLVYNLRILKPSNKDIALDVSGSDYFFDTTEQIISVKIAKKDNRRLLVFVAISGDKDTCLSFVNYAGKKLTKLIGLSGSCGKNRIEFWDLVAPDTGVNDLIAKVSKKADYLDIGYAVIYNASQKNNIIINSSSINSKNAYAGVIPILDNCWSFSMGYPKNNSVQDLKRGKIFVSNLFAWAAHSSGRGGNKITHIYKGFDYAEKWIWAMIAVPSATLVLDRISKVESEILSDNFDDNELNSKWDKHQTRGGILFEKNGQLHFKLKRNKRMSWAGIQTRKPFDFRGCFAEIEIVSAQKGDTWLDLILSREKLPSNNFIVIGVDVSGKRNNAGTPALTALLQMDGTDNLLAVIDYEPNIHRYVRIREHCGTIYFEWSTEGNIWNELYNMSNPFDISSSYLVIDDFAYTDESEPDIHVIDNLKVGAYQSDCFVSGGVLVGNNDELLQIGDNIGLNLKNMDKLEKGKYYWKVRSRNLKKDNEWRDWKDGGFFEIN